MHIFPRTRPAVSKALLRCYYSTYSKHIEDILQNLIKSPSPHDSSPSLASPSPTPPSPAPLSPLPPTKDSLQELFSPLPYKPVTSLSASTPSTAQDLLDVLATMEVSLPPKKTNIIKLKLAPKPHEDSDYNNLLQEYDSEAKHEDMVELFQKIPRRHKTSLTKYSITLVAKALYHLERTDDIAHLLPIMHSLSFTPAEVVEIFDTYKVSKQAALFHRSLRSERHYIFGVDKGLWTNQIILQYGVVLDEHTSGLMLEAHLRSQGHVYALSRFEEIETNLRGTLVYNTLMQAHILEGKPHTGLDAFSNMVKAGVELDKDSYSLLINLLLSVDDIESALQVYEGMLAGGIELTHDIYHALMRGCGRAGRLDYALALLSDMQNTAFSTAKPTEETYFVMIHVCRSCKNSQTEATMLSHKLKLTQTLLQRGKNKN